LGGEKLKLKDATASNTRGLCKAKWGRVLARISLEVLMGCDQARKAVHGKVKRTPEELRNKKTCTERPSAQVANEEKASTREGNSRPAVIDPPIIKSNGGSEKKKC